MSYEQIIDTPLRAARIAKQLSQKQVAAHLHLKNNTMISRWEMRHAFPCLMHALRLAALYGVSVEELFGNMKTGEIPPEENFVKISTPQ